MRIGVFTNAYHPITSGVVNAIDCIDKGLTQLGHQVYIIAPQYPGYQDPSSSVIRFPSIRLTDRADFPLPYPYVPRLIRKIERLQLDCIHAQHPFLLGSLGMRLAKQHHIPTVFTFHTLYEQYVHYAPPILPQFVLRAWVKKRVSSFVKQADAIVVPSPSIVELVKAYGGSDRIHVIPNAIHLQPFQHGDGTEIRKRYGLDSKKVLTFVGRLAEEKNISFLLCVLAQIKMKIPDAVFLLVGDGPYRKALEEQTAMLRLTENVIFTGMVPYTQVPNYLKAADLFVTASTTEVKPLSLLETMACGVPILAVNASGAMDTITSGKDGQLVSENDHEFAAAAVDLLQNPSKLRQLGDNAKKTAEGFGIETMAKKLESLYGKLITAGR